MKRTFAFLLAACLLAGALTACGGASQRGPAGAAGLLGQEEIALYESLFFTEPSGLLAGLGLKEEDVDRQDKALEEAGLWLLREPREIAGTPFKAMLMTSPSQPEGLYGVWFQASFSDSATARQALLRLYEEAVALYGEPGTFPGFEEDAYLSRQLQDPKSGFEDWLLGDMTDLRLSFYSAGGDGSSQAGYFSTIEIQYRVQSFVDGERLSADEIVARVRQIQQKQP
ncbi:hypothetical protein [Acutalibacter caecimuris]|uniref:hypothetical protein n=1 Tax=Acutalibacter caecimuris TaxID=3093657 RepID=UPI002AC9A7AF|nr:hypothetical protein [Acutalibacter sp. M00118]